MARRKKSPAAPDADRPPLSAEEGERRQRAYAAQRRAWADAVGRPYRRREDPRPPPGEVDAGPDE